MIVIISIVSSLASMSIILLIYSYIMFKKQEIIRKMERQLIAPKERKFTILGMLGYENFINNIQKLIKSAGLHIEAENFILLVALINAVFFAASLLLNFGYLSIAVIAILDFAVFFGLIKISENKKKKRDIQFADAAQDIADYLKVSDGIINAFEKITPELENPLRSDFEKIINKVHAGISMTQALKEFSDEINSPLIEAWVESVIFASQMKANIADVCEKTSIKVKKRLKQNRQIKALMMQTKSIMYSITGIMGLIMIALFMSSPEYVQSLSTTLGKIALIYTILSYFFTTFYVLRKINRMIGTV